jgi:galactose oxidase
MPPMVMVMATAAAEIPDAPTLTPEGWTATSTTSATGHAADAVIDGKSSTYWESQSPTSRGALPQSITIDMRGLQEVSSLTYEPRRGAHRSGGIGRFAVNVSTDGVHFGAPVATGTWADDAAVKEIGFTPVTVRMVRLTALSTAVGSGSYVTAAEIHLQGAPQVTSSSSTAEKSPALSTNPAVVGEWGPTIGFPLVPAAAALLPDNQLLVWSADADMDFAADNNPGSDLTQTAILNLTTGVVSQDTVTNTDHNMFCPGVAILANGDIMVTGGDDDDKTSIYDPATSTWTAGPPMNIGRGYQGMTLLSNGQAFTLGGSWSGALGGKLGEVWSATGGWRELTNVPATPMYTADAQGVYRADNHGWFIATSDGRVLQAGPSKQMNWITTNGSGSITPAGVRGTSGDAMNGNAVYYSTDKIITMGGAPDYSDSYATNQAYEINISTGNPQVKQVGSMHDARTFANSVVLPDGHVLTVGGEDYGVPFSDATSVLNPEMWNDTTGKFTVMAPEAEPRNYHSEAVLLPDGTVFSGGGGLCGSCATNHPDGQIFTPPYLLNANGSLRVRPTIITAPQSAATGQTITVTTGQRVSTFSMVRYGESTHSVDNDQRRIPLSIVSRHEDTYELRIPADPGIALPGPYMLFALNARGTPSVSTTISITNAATQAPADAYGQAVFNDGPSVYWPLGDATGPTVADASGNGDTGNAVGGVAYGTPSPVEGTSGTGVTLDGSSGQIVASQAITDPTTYSEEMWFKTTTTTGGFLMGFGSSPTGLSSDQDRQVWMSDDGRLNFGVFTGTPVTIQSPGTYNDGSWHHVVATQGSDGMKLYVDGQLVGSNSTSQSQSDVGYWRVGADSVAGWPDQPTSNYFGATISDVAFYDTELSAAQVRAHYEASPAA